LKAGDRVVTSNHYRLQPGARIRANAPANAATGGRPPLAGGNRGAAAEPAP